MGAAKKLETKHNEHPAEQHHAEDPLAHKKHKKHEDSEAIWLMSYADMMTLLMGFFALIASFSKVDATEFEKVKKEAVKYFGGEYERPYGGLTERLKKVVESQGLTSQVEIEELPDGVKMTIKGTLLFDSGAYNVKAASVPVMDQLVQAIAKEAKTYLILVEGHTDNVPIVNDIIASNWELSGLRAARVARLFEERGFGKNQLTIVGWGETKPLVSNENPDKTPNVANQSKNRRVVIKIHKDQP